MTIKAETTPDTPSFSVSISIDDVWHLPKGHDYLTRCGLTFDDWDHRAWADHIRGDPASCPTCWAVA